MTWDGLVHVRSIEPCAGKGWGHHPDHKHSRQRKKRHREESKQTNFTIPLIILFMNNGNKREKNGSLNKAFCVIFKVSNFVFIEVL